MLTEPKNNKESNIYKSNSNLVSFFAQKDEIKQLVKVERDSQIVKYGKKSYVSKLLSLFSSDIKSGTSSYWLEVGE